MLFDYLGERSSNWLRARKPQESDTSLSWPDPMTDEAAKNILAVVAKQKEGSFKPQERGTPLVLVWVTQSTSVVCEASRPGWAGRKDFLSMPRCTENMTATRKL